MVTWIKVEIKVDSLLAVATHNEVCVCVCVCPCLQCLIIYDSLIYVPISIHISELFKTTLLHEK